MSRRRMCRGDIEELLYDEGYDKLIVKGGGEKTPCLNAI